MSKPKGSRVRLPPYIQVPISWGRTHLRACVLFAEAGPAVILTRFGRPDAVLLSLDRYEDLLESSGDEEAQLAYLLHRVFPERSDRAKWLEREVPALGDRKPAELIAQGSTRPVIGVLASLRAGAFL